MEKMAMKHWRGARGLSQKELAEKVGVTETSIWNFENRGFGTAKFETVMKIVKVLNIKLDQLEIK